MGWDVDGVKGETRFTKLLYSEAAGVVLVQFERDVGRIPMRSLYIRGRDADEYRRVYGGDDRRTAHDVVLRTKSTNAFFLVMLKSEVTRGGFDIECIARLDLTTGLVTTALDMETYSKKNEDGWISDLFDIEDDDRTLLCRTASWRTPKPNDGPRRGGGVGYWLSRVNLDTAEVEQITYLPHVGF